MTLLLFLLLVFARVSFCDELTRDPPVLPENPCPPCPLPCTAPLIEAKVEMDLRNPIYEGGCLRTTEGGVLCYEGLRVQARSMAYTRLLDDEPPRHCVTCEGEIFVEYEGQALAGSSLSYDFMEQCGVLRDGRGAFFPWFVSGEEILLCANGDLIVVNGKVTTSEGGEDEIVLAAKRIVLTKKRMLVAQGISLAVKGVPLMAFPEVKIDLNARQETPFAINAGWNGFLGSHVGIRYHLLTFHGMRGYLRADGYFGKGLGIGFETEYDPCDSPTRFFTRNYYAHDLSIDDPHKRDRYRYQGTYFTRLDAQNTSVNLIYDFVSDPQMAADYETKDFDLRTAYRTELKIHKCASAYLANLTTRVRVNSFQTINQELPVLDLHLHPCEIDDTGLIFDGRAQGGYLSYVFSNEVKNTRNFHSGRFEIRPRLAYPMSAGAFRITPEATLVGIGYTSNPRGHSTALFSLDGACHAAASYTAYTDCFKGRFEPYATYRFLTHPTSGLNDHFLFTIDDAYDTLNYIRFGLRHALYIPSCQLFASPLFLDIWSNHFLTGKAGTLPKGYLSCTFQPTPFLFLDAEGAWNFRNRQLDYYNARLTWSLSPSCAISAEYRHRSAFDYRKADFYNFLLETVRSQTDLLASPLSDRRDTFLAKTFFRITPDLAARVEYRHGWLRTFQPSYNEYLVELMTHLFSHVRLHFTYEKRTEDHRFFITLKLDEGPPSDLRFCP